MSTFRIFLLVLAVLIIGACGGGGGGSIAPANATLTGRVLSVETGGATNPRSSIQVGAASVIQQDDGSFQLTVPAGSTTATVDTRSAWGTYSFTYPAATGTTDVGDLWVGPTKVTVTGKVLNAADNSVVKDVAVSFAGRSGVTNAAGVFTLTNVAYSNATQTTFFGITGSARKDGFVKADFTASPNVAVAGKVTVNDILISPAGDINPPPGPYNIWGRVSPSALAPGTAVTLKLNGTAVRSFTVASDTIYYFWVLPGNYTLEFVNGTHTASATANLAAVNEVIRKDVVLN